MAGAAGAAERSDPSAPLSAFPPPMPVEPPGRSPFPPIGEYAFLSDCESMALVAASGNVEWLCLPRVDSPSVYGAMLDCFYLHTRSRDRLDDRMWQILVRQVEAAIAHWREPDCGLWEVRGEPKHFTTSKVMCWVAVDRGARLASLREENELAGRWRAIAEEIHADVCANGVDERGVFTQHYDTDALDASVLLLPLVRFLPPDDPRIRATRCWRSPTS